jgi:hypothetical protein
MAERSGPRLSGRSCGRQRGLAGDHAAADVHTDRGRDDRAQGRDHRADGGADAEVHVGHRGDVLEHDRQARRVLSWRLAAFSTGTPRVHILSGTPPGRLRGCDWFPC